MNVCVLLKWLFLSLNKKNKKVLKLESIFSVFLDGHSSISLNKFLYFQNRGQMVIYETWVWCEITNGLQTFQYNAIC